MDRSPFIEDPRELMSQHIALAVDSPIEAVRAFHIGAAQHSAEIAAASGLPVRPVTATADGDSAQRQARRVIAIAFVCLFVAVAGMLALGLSLLRS